MNGVLEGLKALGIGRLVAMGAVAAGVFGLLLVLALHGGTARMALLYGDLDLRESAQMAELLDRQHIPHATGAGGGTLLVPADRIDEARLLLARDGLPSGGSVGYEIFDRGDGLLASTFTETINQTRALEGELARTIRTIRGVRAARVHIVLPHREPFAREAQPAQASVLLTLAGSQRPDREEVQAILNLVAAAVPGLRPENVTLADSRGSLLARAGEAAGPLGEATAIETMQHTAEQRLARAVEDMLAPSLGAGHVEAQASIDMDLDQVHETQERFDPDGQVVRSTQTVSDQNQSTEATAAAGVQNNLPNPDPGTANGTGRQEKHQEETTNYEIGKTVRSIVREHPQIRRISLAVMVDGVEEKDAKGVAHWRARTADELARITALVRGAIGYDEKRGDHVEVASMMFTHDAEPAAAPALLGLPLAQPDLMRLAQTGLIGLLGLAALLFVLRPTVLRIAQLAAVESEAGPLALAGAAAAVAGVAGGTAIAAGGVPRLPAPTATAAAAAAEEVEAMVALANVEGQIRASSIRRIAEMVDKHPEESLTILRTWLQQAPT
jgi:flagellar M-ring protein FliF